MRDWGVQEEVVAKRRRDHVVKARGRDRRVGPGDRAGVSREADAVFGPAGDDQAVKPVACRACEVGVVERPGVIATERWAALDQADAHIAPGADQAPCGEAAGEPATCDYDLDHLDWLG